MRRLVTLVIALCFGAGCASYGVSWTQTANDAIQCTVGILSEVSAGQADPALKSLGHNPTIDQIVQALKDAQAMLPTTIAACAAFAADFTLPVTPTPVTLPPVKAEVGPKVVNPWRK